MKKGILFLMLSVLTLGAWADDVTAVVDNISSYSGTASYVYNNADGKVYARNNTGAYELYGIYEKVGNLNVRQSGTREIEYIKSPDGAYINLNYIPKNNTRAVAVIKAETGGDWKAVYGCGYEDGSWKNRFCFFTTNATINLEGETTNTGQMVYSEKIWTVLDAADGTLKIYDNESMTNLRGTITDRPKTESQTCQTPLYVFAQNKNFPNGSHIQTDCYNPLVTLYGLKLYEGETLVMDLVPVVSNGKGGLKDKLTGTIYFSANDKDFALSPDAGITVYDGKMVCCYTDGKLYKYNGSAFVESGTCLTEIENDNYKNLNNWETNNDHKAVFENNWTQTTNGYKIVNYQGTGGHEPLMIKIDTEVGADYNYSFTYSGSQYTSWHNREMRAYVANFWDLATQETAATVSSSVLATQALPYHATTDMAVSLNFTADKTDQTLVFQFGDVEDGNKGYWFEFDNLSVKKYTFPVSYSDLEVAIKSIAWAKDKGIDTSIAETLLAQAIVENSGSPKDIVVLALKQTQAEKSSQPTIFTMISESVVGTDDNNYGTIVNDRADGFYVYNVGTGRWFCGGDDWGAHAAVGFPGIKVTTPKNDYGSGHYNSVVTWLCNGNWGTSCQLNHGGYCDTGGNGWKFFKQNAAQGIYTWAKNGNDSGDNSGNGYGTKNLVGFAPSSYARVNTDRTDANDPYNQWIFVTEAQRDQMAAAAMATASESNPVDLTYKIKMPGFNQRERKEGTNQSSEELDWTCNRANYCYNASDNGSRKIIMGRNDNHADFVCDVYGYTWNEFGNGDDSFSWTQTVTGLTPGKYRVKVQGYNNGGEIANKASLVANGQKVALVERSSESVLPWTSGLPQNTFDNPEYFQVGCYWNQVICTVGSNGELTLGVESPSITGGHVVIFDNFRLEYVGTASESVSVGNLSYATYASDNALDFTGSGIKAFYATESEGTLSFTQIDKVPANTGVLLYADGGATVDVPLTGTADDVTGNVFVRGTGVAVTYAADNQNYILFNGDDGIGFYKANSDLKDSKDLNDSKVIYNLAGQRLSKTQKGINIVNGKKILK